MRFCTIQQVIVIINRLSIFSRRRRLLFTVINWDFLYYIMMIDDYLYDLLLFVKEFYLCRYNVGTWYNISIDRSYGKPYGIERNSEPLYARRRRGLAFYENND